jgi:4-hydroxybenzoyl-CoA reductase alpha subunit
MVDGQWVGKRVPRVDSLPKAMGLAKFTNDVFLPNMLYGKILRSPYPHARILNIDIKRAGQLRGVKVIITGKDTPGVKYGILPEMRDQYLLPIDKVRYIGEEVAAVAAIDEEIAQEALALIRVEYEPLGAVFDPLEAMKEGAPQIHGHAPNNISHKVLIEHGNITKGFKESAQILREHFETVSLSHCQLEPYVSIASYDPASERLMMWMPHQSPFVKQKGLSNTLRIPLTKIRILKSYIGGAFGGRSEVSPADFCAALLSMKSGRPVKISYLREETFTHTRQKHPWLIDIEIGAQKDGRLTGAKVNIIADGGAYNSTGHIAISIPYAMLESTYRIPNIRYEAIRTYTNHPIRGAMKGHGVQQLFFVIESCLDMLAEVLGLDPLEIRLKNIVQEGEKLNSGSFVTSCGLRDCLIRSAEVSQFKAKWNNPQKKRGIGIGCCSMINGYNMGFRTGSTAYIKFNEEGEVVLFTGTTDNGQGNDSMMVQIVAEELGIGMEDIELVSADTDLSPMDPGSYSMSSTFISANAVKKAASIAKKQLIAIAAELLEANPLDIELRNRIASIQGTPSKAIPIKQLVKKAFEKGTPIFGDGHFRPNLDFKGGWIASGEQRGQITGAYSFGSAVAEVEVDRETGQTKVLKVIGAQDCGFAINPVAVAGQIDGSVLFSLGQSLYEELILSQGQVLNGNFLDYKFPVALDMPEIQSIIIESKDPNGPYGAKEAAEALGPAIIPAIANAISNATGLRPTSLPMTPEKMVELIKNSKVKNESMGPTKGGEWQGRK